MPSTIFWTAAGGLPWTWADGDLALGVQVRLGHLVPGDVGGIGGRDLQAQVLDEGAKFVGAGDEVGLAIHLDQHAHLAADVDVAFDQALPGRAVRLLGRGRGAPSCEGG